VIAEQWSFRMPILDLSEKTAVDLNTEVQRLFEIERRRPFDLSTDLVFRATLLRLGADEHVLFLNSHHIAWDHWCIELFFRELSILYQAFVAGQASPLPQLPVQYKHYAFWQRKVFQGRELESHLVYWKQQLKGAPPSLKLPTDYPRKPLGNRCGRHQSVLLPNGLSEELKILSRKAGVSFFMTLLAAFQTLLHRMTGQDDIVVGTPVAGRDRSETEGLIGLFLNSLALRTDLSGNPTFLEFLRRVREVALGAYDHQDLPFEKIAQELQPERDLTQTPIFQVFINMYNFKEASLKLNQLSVKRIEAFEPAPQFDIELNIREHDDGIHLIFAYDSDLFDAATITRMLGHFKILLEGIVTNPEQPISELPLLTGAERHQLLAEWNDTKADYPRDQCIHELFEAQVERSPEAVAVVFPARGSGPGEDQRLSYRELNRRANHLGHYLKKLGVGPETLVGICVERSLEMVVGLLGILKAGGAYVPLDPGYPKDRLAFIMADTRAAVLLTQAGLITDLPESRAEVVCLDRDWEEIAEQSGANPISATTAESLAYVIYTSGSTGQPKGVEVPHRGVVRLLFGVEYVQLNGSETLLHLAPISFDASMFELWGALLHGAKCVLFPAKIPSSHELGNILHDHGTSTLWLTASLFNTVIDEVPEALSGVSQLLVGGEALSVSHVRRALAALPATQIVNGYGPTESTTFTCCYPIPARLDESVCTIPIGRPIANTEVYLLDLHGSPVPPGIPGELYIGGDGLARGYLNRPELTAQKFVPHPFTSRAGARLYKTGDLARYLPDGNIEFLGRLDDQVKIRGFRIEPGEIEAVLTRHPAVREAVVVAREDNPGDKRLVVYVVGKGDEQPQAAELKQFLKDKLPDYMVPSAWVSLDSLPHTPNGKINRAALPAPAAGQLDPSAKFTAPRTQVEKTLARVWAEVLKLERVGIQDNFFDLGGHSLLATQVLSRLRNDFSKEIPLRILFESPTIEQMAAVIMEDQESS
jgi:aspartate racemase